MASSLPDHWGRGFGGPEDATPYWFNRVTGEVVWTMPAELERADADADANAEPLEEAPPRDETHNSADDDDRGSDRRSDRGFEQRDESPVAPADSAASFFAMPRVAVDEAEAATRAASPAPASDAVLRAAEQRAEALAAGMAALESRVRAYEVELALLRRRNEELEARATAAEARLQRADETPRGGGGSLVLEAGSQLHAAWALSAAAAARHPATAVQPVVRRSSFADVRVDALRRGGGAAPVAGGSTAITDRSRGIDFTPATWRVLTEMGLASALLARPAAR